MCGLVGAAGRLLYQDEFIMKRMLFFDYVRGPDSTGMAAVRTNGDVELAKASLNPIDFMQYEPFKKACNGAQSRAFIGHNRLRTRGSVSSFNAHPFQFDHITGAHNGTLDYESVKRLEEALGEKFEVDSRAIFAGFAKLGVKKTIELCTEGKDSKEGAWALVWHDKDKGTLNFLRNKHRSLYFAYEKDFKRMYWSSESWMMKEAIAASPNSFDFYTEVQGDIKNVAFFLFEPDVWYSYKLDDLVAGSNKRPKPKAVPLKGREPAPAVVTTTGKDPFGRGEKETWFQPRSPTSGTHGTTATNHNSTKKTACSSTAKTDDSKRKVIQLSGTELHPYANVITEGQFVTFGTACSYCNAPVEFGQRGLTIFERDGRVLCPDCCNSSPSFPTRIYIPGSEFDTYA